MMIIPALLLCCSLPPFISLTPLMRGENLIRPESKIGESRTILDARLPWYTSGFE